MKVWLPVERDRKQLQPSVRLADLQSREELIWDANGGLTEKQIEQYLIVARYVFLSLSLSHARPSSSRSIGTFARALDCPTALKHPSLHMSAASASRDATLVNAIDFPSIVSYSQSPFTLSLVLRHGHTTQTSLWLGHCHLQSSPEHRADSRQRPNGRLVCSRSELFRRCHREVRQRFRWNTEGIRKRAGDLIFGMERQRERLSQLVTVEEFERNHWILLHVENNGSIRGTTTFETCRTREQTETSVHSQLVRRQARFCSFDRLLLLSSSNKAHQCLLPQRPQPENKPCESCGSKSDQSIDYSWKKCSLFFSQRQRRRSGINGVRHIHTHGCALNVGPTTRNQAGWNTRKRAVRGFFAVVQREREIFCAFQDRIDDKVYISVMTLSIWSLFVCDLSCRTGGEYQ